MRNFYAQVIGQVSKIELAPSPDRRGHARMAEIWVQKSVEEYQYGGMFAFLANLASAESGMCCEEGERRILQATSTKLIRASPTLRVVRIPKVLIQIALKGSAALVETLELLKLSSTTEMLRDIVPYS